TCLSSPRFALGRATRSTPLPYTTLFRSGGRKPAAIRREAQRVGRIIGPCGAITRDKVMGHDVIESRFEPDLAQNRRAGPARGFRSEEHTSELQSRENLVCRLLLEKKNTT